MEKSHTIALDEVAPRIKEVFERFLSTLDITIGEEFYIHSYDSTLTTTYHDSRNPLHAEKKKISNIGRKYYVSLLRALGEWEYNLITIELNGLDNLFFIDTTEVSKGIRLSNM